MKKQFVVTHKIRQTEIPALIDNWVTNTPVKIVYLQKKKKKKKKARIFVKT
jgi:hypothetical protein